MCHLQVILHLGLLTCWFVSHFFIVKIVTCWSRKMYICITVYQKDCIFAWGISRLESERLACVQWCANECLAPPSAICGVCLVNIVIWVWSLWVGRDMVCFCCWQELASSNSSWYKLTCPLCYTVPYSTSGLYCFFTFVSCVLFGLQVYVPQYSISLIAMFSIGADYLGLEIKKKKTSSHNET